MTSRDKILASVQQNQPATTPLPAIQHYNFPGTVQQYMATLLSIGGAVHHVNSYDEIAAIIKDTLAPGTRITSYHPAFASFAEVAVYYADGHTLENVELAILSSPLAVAENAAIWLDNSLLPHRALPFIAQQLAIVIHAEDIVPTMQHAYDKIGSDEYSYGVFIAGPSRTADIEQSLVLGAHGPKGMTVFVLSDNE